MGSVGGRGWRCVHPPVRYSAISRAGDKGTTVNEAKRGTVHTKRPGVVVVAIVAVVAVVAPTPGVGGMTFVVVAKAPAVRNNCRTTKREIFDLMIWELQEMGFRDNGILIERT